MSKTIDELLHAGLLSECQTETARLDLEVILAHTLQKNRVYLYTWPEKEVTGQQYQDFISMVERRKAGEPVAHIIGQREFWSLPLSVNPSTLIPRPDTEIMVETVLQTFSPTTSLSMLDLGTGTGAIGLALASECKAWVVTAMDYSLEACSLAKKNAKSLNLKNVHIFCGRWLEAIGFAKFNLIVSNPPYIRENDPHLSQGDVRFEPLSALTSGKDGLDDIRVILSTSRKHLEEGGVLFLEHGFDQAEEVRALFLAEGYHSVSTVVDYGGNPRITYGHWQ